MDEIARPLREWHEDIGPVLWWRFPVDEPPYVGTPLDLGQTVVAELKAWGSSSQASLLVGGWPGYHTHWTRIPVPAGPAEP